MTENKKIRSVLSFIILLTFTSMYSQHQTSSPLSRYGLGEMATIYNGDNAAMSGLSIGLRSPSHINTNNPASYSAFPLNGFIFEVGFHSKFSSFKTETETVKTTNINIDHFSIGFPITKWWGASAGVYPYSYVGYDASSTKSIQLTDLSSLEIPTFFKGEGGINQFHIGNAFKPIKSLSVGLNVKYLFGTIDRETTTSFLYSVKDGAMVTTTTNVKLNDFIFDAGLQYSLKINDKLRTVFGAVVTNEKKFTVNQVNTIDLRRTSKSATNVISNDTLNSSIQMPLKYGVGINVITKSFEIGLDYTEQDWTGAKLFDVEDKQLTKNSILTAGMQYTPDMHSTTYYKIMRYKVGGRINNTYYAFTPNSDQNNSLNTIKQYAVNFGVEFPLIQSKTLVSASCEIGNIGPEKNMSFKEKYVLFSINLAFKDIWFVKRKFY